MKKDGPGKIKFEEFLYSTDGTKVYTIDFQSKVIQRNADGSGKKVIFTQIESLNGNKDKLTGYKLQMIKDGWIYYTITTKQVRSDKSVVSEQTALYRMTMAGQDKTPLLQLRKEEQSIGVLGTINKRLYYEVILQGGKREIWSVLLDGRDKQRFTELSAQDAKEIAYKQELAAKFAPYSIVNTSEGSTHFIKGKDSILSYAEHDVGNGGWTINMPRSEQAESFPLLQKVLDYYNKLQFSEEQLQQIRALIKSGEQDHIEMKLGEFELTVYHKFANDPQGSVLINAIRVKK